MPGFSIVLPHWLYWGALIAFPLIAILMARRSSTIGSPVRSLPIGYFILVTGGILGLHRFYMKNLWGFLYIPLFIAILYSNGAQRDARAVVSNLANDVKRAEATIAREEPRAAAATAELPELRAAVAAAEPGSLGARRAERRLKRAESRAERSAQRVEEAKATLVTDKPRLDEAEAAQSFWSNLALYSFFAILVFMAVDALLLPLMARKANANVGEEAPAPASEAEQQIHDLEEAETKGDEAHVAKGGLIGAIDRTAFYAGEFVAYWTVIAVMVYYFEVVLRYVFNSPTIWAHEGMFLMFGMQYLIAGSFAMLTESHVRVDIFYAKFSTRMKAFVDVLTSIFFFIFAGTLLLTGYIFAMDATRVGEISVQEWAIPYWPVKWAIFVGAVLLLLQGLAKLAKDITILATGDDGASPQTA